METEQVKDMLFKLFPEAIESIEDEAIERGMPRRFAEMQNAMHDEMAARPKSPMPLPEIGDRIHLYSARPEGNYEVMAVHLSTRRITITCNIWKLNLDPNKWYKTIPFSDFKCREGEGHLVRDHERLV